MMEKKKIRIGLLPRIILAILLGVAMGHVLPAWAVRVFVTFNGIFSEFLTFIIPLIIVGLVVPAISDIGKGAGRMLLFTVLLAYGATLFSGFLSYGTGSLVFPHLIDTSSSLSAVTDASAPKPYFSVPIPPMMDVMTALVLAFTLGLGLAGLASDALKRVFDDFRDIISAVIRVVILPLLPLYIFGIFLNMTHTGQVWAILVVFIKIILTSCRHQHRNDGACKQHILFHTDLNLMLSTISLPAGKLSEIRISVYVILRNRPPVAQEFALLILRSDIKVIFGCRHHIHAIEITIQNRFSLLPATQVIPSQP